MGVNYRPGTRQRDGIILRDPVTLAYADYFRRTGESTADAAARLVLKGSLSNNNVEGCIADARRQQSRNESPTNAAALRQLASTGSKKGLPKVGIIVTDRAILDLLRMQARAGESTAAVATRLVCDAVWDIGTINCRTAEIRAARRTA